MTMAVLSPTRDVLTAFAVEEAGATLRISVPPYDIFASKRQQTRSIDDALITRFKRADQSVWRCFWISDEGGIASADLEPVTTTEEPGRGLETLWSDQVTALTLKTLSQPLEGEILESSQTQNAAGEDEKPKARDMQRFWNCESHAGRIYRPIYLT
jgi:hypothetical protein